MTTYSGGNTIAYGNHFVDICPNQLSLGGKENTNAVSDVNVCEEPDANEQMVNTNEDQPEVDIDINNVVCSFNVRCHLNLRQIALHGANVEYRREHGMVIMKLRKPYTTASIWSSGKITCTGATSNADAKIASRKFARILQQLGFRVKFTNFRVVNVLGTCVMPFGIKISHFAEKYRQAASYEPELHPGVTFKIKELKATLKIFTTGSITITAPSIENIQHAVEHIFPLVYEFQKEKPPPKIKKLKDSPYVAREQIYDGCTVYKKFSYGNDTIESDDTSDLPDSGSDSSME